MASDAAIKWTEEQLRYNVGQLFIVGFHGHVPSEDIKTLIADHKVGAIVLFQRNVESGSQLLALTNSLQDIAKSAGHKHALFIAIDQENGLVTRIKAPIAAQLPGSMALGATGDPSNAYKVALATAETLKSFGVNMNYAPIADVNSEPKNPVIGVRSPSDDPETVGRFVSSQIRGLKEGGIVPCVKHFPGHGDTAVDSHYGLPVISKSKAALEDCEFIPFRRAISERVDSVMTAHITMPLIERLNVAADHPSKTLPASLNPEAINILRNEMKFDGLIISDCLEMDGVRATYGTEKSAVMALKAGTDCVMICHTMSAQVNAIELVVEAVKKGELSQNAILASVVRVKSLKDKYITGFPSPSTDIQRLESTRAVQSALASRIYAKSTTLVRHVPVIFPTLKVLGTKIVFISPGKKSLEGGAVDSGEEKTREPYTPAEYFNLLKAHNAQILEVRFYDSIPLSAESEKRIQEADIVIFATRNASLSTYQKDFGLTLGSKFGEKLIVIATCDPYDFLEEVDEIKNYITIYEPTIPAFKSAVDVLFGITQAVGQLPVGSRPVQHEIRRFEGTDAEIIHICTLWQEIFPTWPIEPERLNALLKLDMGSHHYLHEQGFCLSYLSGTSGSGSISCVAVRESYRGKGIGTTLMTTARQGLRESSLPNRDFFRSIKSDIAPQGVLDRVSKLPLTFSPLTPELYDECITAQRTNFSHNQAWISAYEYLAKTNQHHEAMVAFGGTGAQVGWTLMCSHSCPMVGGFAFLPLLPSKDKTGLIACVGVDKEARGKGIGLALLVAALKNMQERGVEGVLIDWVAIRGFYEILGFEPVLETDVYRW